MPDEKVALTSAHQVELVVRRLDSLSILPSVAVKFFSRLLQLQFSPSDVVDIIELDPALTAKILPLIHQEDLSLSGENFSLRQALGKLPAHMIRDAFFSVKVFGAFDSGDNRVQLRKGLTLHALAVACCAEEIAEIISPRMNPRLVHCAGLLHDVGKLALEEAMPKSFAHIVEEAKSTEASICTIEQKHLGLDHTILGKRLAQKWHLPYQVALATWLHHSDVVRISKSMPEVRIAQVVQLADSIARQSGIGRSGSFDSPESQEQIAQSLDINFEQLEQIRQRVPETVRQKSEVLGLDLPNAAGTYCDVIHTAAARLAHEHTELSLENRNLQSTSSSFDFIKEFLLSINSSAGAVDIAENFAARWQKFYQTGMVCLYLVPQTDPQSIEAVVVENLSQTKLIYLNAPAEIPAIPDVIAREFAILNAHEYIGWLFGQLDVDFELNQTKLMPLLSDGKAIGAIAFELRYPADIELFQEKFRIATSLAGSILDLACSADEQQCFAEQFAQHLTKPKDTQPLVTKDDSLNALVEMAAGAAHELNNPLSVISGRAQLLDQTETEQGKKQLLKQIQDNAGKISRIIEELMNFARPQEPRPIQTNVRQILDEAVQLTTQKTGVEHVNIQIEVAEDIKSVYVDSAQIVSAIANVFSNAIESYTGTLGPVKVTATTAESGNFVKLQINDLGCGMDAQTLEKATQPFFSAKPAGRQQGMGLAYAQRIIRLNKGELDIISQPGSGTTVTIMLPLK
ncbi:MAG: HDOD domain-containing protein [Phycisphaerae bacterium]|nr:HDOD domain-containing protein [Phycisphaerae bacterium]NIP53996.1 HDOD domain-containing protein [Phycisphaerae bacterium]NIS51305.1 HDOD domain-containing protein [Phycisphaerae bacterium]NIU10398.1 HDOD domain-containing protein [Phycisphaerae bacterium]NIU58096.1 HDOD domain-containing protein [Phycisphaerae bacterium]